MANNRLFIGCKRCAEGKIINTDDPNDLQKYWAEKLLEVAMHEPLFSEVKLKPLTKKEKVKQKIIDICERIIEWASR